MQSYIFFLGAGASVPFGIPTMIEMVANFNKHMKETNYDFRWIVDEIRNNLRDYESFDIEALITVLQDIVDWDTAAQRVFNHPSLHYYTPSGYASFLSYTESIGKNRRNEANQALTAVKNFIGESCEIKQEPYELFTDLFANGRGRGADKHRIELKQRMSENLIFTTNYDLAIDAYCSHLSLDSETGQVRGEILNLTSSNEALYDENLSSHKIYKLHGAINWYSDENGTLRWITEPVKTGKRTALGHKVARELLVYPAFGKYSFREPYYTMFHYLKDVLLRCAICHVVGYSFRDEDILGLFHDAMAIHGKLRLTIIDPVAEQIATERFSDYRDRIECIPTEFNEEATEKLQEIVMKFFP